MSASVSVNDFRGDEPQAGNTLEAPLEDQISVVENVVVVDDIVIETQDLAPDEAARPVAADEVLDGFQDPIMPFVIFGILSLIAIVVVAAMLAL